MIEDRLVSERRSFTTTDGVELSYCVWSRETDSEWRRMVLVLHGIGFHAEPYAVIAGGVNVPGTLFAGLDYRGHGHSGGTRGELPSLGRMLQDIEEWVAHMEADFPSTPVFLLGESMSGPYATLYAARHPRSLSGLILVAPAMLLSWRQIVHPNTLRVIGAMLRRPSSPSVTLDESRINAGRSGSDFASFRMTDPAAIQSISAKYVLRIANAIFRASMKTSIRISAPVLIIHGEKDNILSPLGSRLLIRKFKTADRRLELLPDAYHTILWDSSSPRVFALIERWMRERV